MRELGRTAVALACVVAVAACQQQSADRPPPIASCSGSDCLSPLVGLGSGDSGAETDAGLDAGAVGPITLTGRVRWFDNDLFASTKAYPDPATITAEAQVGGAVTTKFNGAIDFSLDGVLAGRDVWVSATNDTPTDAMTTLVMLPTAFVSDVSIPLVRPSSLDLMFSSLSQFVTRDPLLADVVVFVTSAATTHPLQGLTVSATTAQVVAYVSGASWTDTASATGPLGLAFLGNVTPPSLLGERLKITFSRLVKGTIDVQGTIAVRVAAGATTVVSVAF